MAKVAVFDDHITPYRTAIFSHLSALPGIQLKLLYGAKRLKEREWEIDSRQMHYDYEVLPRVVLRSSKRKFHEPRSIIINPTLFPRLAAYNPDVVVGYAFSAPTLVSLSYAKLFGKRFVSWSTGTLQSESYYSKAQKFIRRIVIRQAEACVTASNQGAANYLHYGADRDRIRIVLQPPPLAFRDACREARAGQITYARKMGLFGKVILYVGALSERKGVAHLLEAFIALRQLRSDIILLLAGNGPLKESLRARAFAGGVGDSVHFAGFVQPPQLPEVYASADVFVLPTLEDNFGAVLAEAAGAGLPLIGTPYAGASEHFIAPGKNGYIVDPVDHAGLCHALDQVFSHPRPEELRNASASIAERNDVNASVKQFAEAIEIALQRGCQPVTQSA